MFKRTKVDILGGKKYLVFKIRFKEDSLLQAPWVYVTTEENAYGVVAGRWMDGEVVPFRLKRGKYVFVNLDNVHQYNYLIHSCTEQSYYQCLSSELTKEENCAEHGGMCDAVSLPSVHFPRCPTAGARNCSLNAFWAAFDSESLCKKQKSCRTMEYRIENGIWKLQCEKIESPKKESPKIE